MSLFGVSGAMRVRRGSLFGTIRLAVFSGLLLAGAAVLAQEVRETRDRIAERLCGQFTTEQLLQLDGTRIEAAITPEEKRIFAERYWRFDVNVAVVVSVLRDVKQERVAFWLPESGFVLTDMRVRNEMYEYEVWQKSFPAGPVGLGINGYENHRPHYLVAVGPQSPGDKVELANVFPAGQQISTLRRGASFYHDWPGLVVEAMPAALDGQVLLPTIRGRARESHLLGAFRKAPVSATGGNDLPVLTWNDDPSTTMTVQWRARQEVTETKIWYREKGTAANDPGEKHPSVSNDGTWTVAPAETTVLEDALIVNEPRIHHCTATLRGLKPATRYEYKICGAGGEFTTAHAEPAPFRFVYVSDTHNTPALKELGASVIAREPNFAFWTITGDLVGVGQYRDDWEELFLHADMLGRSYPLMPCTGNHDALDGLGMDLYRGLLELPRNGPSFLQPEQAYSFTYANAFFIMPDVTEDIAGQAPWIEQQLAQSKADWRFALLHFPPYAPDDENPEIVKHWLPLFERYGVDFVLSGHVHHYMRTHPLRQGKKVAPGEGVVYMTTVSCPGGHEPISKPEYAEVFDASGAPLAVVFEIDGPRLRLDCRDATGRVFDSWEVTQGSPAR